MKFRFQIIAALLLLSSCGKIRIPINVSMELPYTKDFSGPSLDTTAHLPPGGIKFSTAVQPIATDVQTKLTEKNLTADQISRIQLTSYVQKISGENFDFIDSVKLFISASGLPELAAASQTSMPRSVTEVNMVCTTDDLKTYLLKDTIYIRMEGHFNKIPKPSNFHTDLSFKVTANLTKELN